MLQETILRLEGVESLEKPIIVCNVDHRFIVAEQCRDINLSNPTILLEPVGKNTAPAIAIAALQAIKTLSDSILLVLSADHIIQDVEAFHEAIHTAVQHAKQGKLVTFGVVPTCVHTGYGYIKASTTHAQGAYQVEHFAEKPDLKTAQHYLQQGGYLWNSGMFMFKASVLIDDLTECAPNIVDSARESLLYAVQDLDFIRLDPKRFQLSPSDSIDYALIEKSKNVVTIQLDAKWSDVGSWSELYNISEKDSNNNVIKGDVFAVHTANTYINSGDRMIVTIGVENLIIVNTPNAILVLEKDRAQEVKSIVEVLQKNKREEALSHRKNYRPWGWYDSIETGKNFQVKRLHVNPGAKLSLQTHQYRAEHWVVVNGEASVVNGSHTTVLKAGESTYIPVGAMHELQNKTREPLEVIEVQSGSYLGEDDIVRFRDDYGRIESEK